MKIVWIVAGALVLLLLFVFLLACIGIVGAGMDMKAWDKDMRD